MEIHIIFFMLLGLSIILILAIVYTLNKFAKLLKSNQYREKVAQSTMDKKKTFLSILVLCTVTSIEAKPVVTPYMSWVSLPIIWGLLALDVLLLLIFLYLRRLLIRQIYVDKGEEAFLAARKRLANDLRENLIGAVPIKEEGSILLDHEYDGIQELDNVPPHWWNWGFLISIFIAIGYLLRFHVFDMSDLPIEAYHKNIKFAQEQIDLYLERQGMDIDEHNVVYLDKPQDLIKGEELFSQHCKTCHGELGQGIVGPNLSDAYWIYGGSIKDIFSVIKNGAKNGMKSWKDDLNPRQIQQIASFIKTLKGTVVLNAKAPEGAFYEESSL